MRNNKKNLSILLSVLVISFASSVCGKESKANETANAHNNGQLVIHRGKVIETMNSGGYTYIEIDENGKSLWAAAREFPVKKGEMAAFAEGMPMMNFESKTLKKTFSLIYFVAAVNIGDKANGPSTDPSASSRVSTSKQVTSGSVTKAAGGYTVAEIYAQKNNLNGKTVVIHGKIVKYTANIMGKNFLHIQDGTGAEGSHDLTVTSSKTFKSGEIVLITGKLETNKNFGAGYLYPVIIEEPKIEVK